MLATSTCVCLLRAIVLNLNGQLSSLFQKAKVIFEDSYYFSFAFMFSSMAVSTNTATKDKHGKDGL